MAKKIRLIFTALSFLTLLVLASVKPSFAAVRCETQYGGGELCVTTGELQINKSVCDPDKGTCNLDTGSFVDNLGLTSHRFSPGDSVFFRLQIKNVGDKKFDKVTVSDTLPSLLTLTSGNLSFDITNLNPGDTVERKFQTQVVSSSNFPSDNSIVCVVNTASVKDANSDNHDQDTSQVCLERKVLGVSAQPATGPQNWFLIFFVSFLAGLTGLFLRGLTKFYRG